MPGFRLYTEDRSLMFTARYDKVPRQVSGGPVLARIMLPKRKELTEWTGRATFSFELSFLLDNFDSQEGLPIEQEIRKLEKMQGLDQGDPEPHQVIMMGDPPGSIPHDFHDNPRARWWVENVVYNDDKTEKNSAGNRVRVYGVIKVTEVSEGELLTATAKKPASKSSRYTIKKGDTLAKIASKYKIKGGWKTLAKLNKIRDPKRLRVGQVIKLK
jgi:hypothetical protein